MSFDIKYKIMQLTSTKSPEYSEAMKIYIQSIDIAQKTSTNEIGYWINNNNKFPLGDLLFFVLMSNDNVIGYAELSYIKSTRILIIDYILVDDKYNSNSAFYTFYWLIINYLNNANIDYDFMTKEILCKFDNTNLYRSEIKMYELENFKVANCLYIQPQLETNNMESEKEALLMIYQKSIDTHTLKSDTYLSIVETIYMYYQTWDRPFLKDKEESTYYNKYERYLNNISESISVNGYVIMNGYPQKQSSSSNDKSIPSKSVPTIRNALFYTALILIFTIGVLSFSKILNIELATIAIVTVAILFVTLSFIALSDSKAAQIIKSLPIFSKLFALLK